MTVADHHTKATGPMLMVITLKSGVQIKVDVSEYTVSRNRLAGIVGLRWQATQDTTMVPEYIDMDQIAAVHSEWPPATGDPKA